MLQVHSNLMSIANVDMCTIGFYPERARGYSQYVLSQKEVQARQSLGEVDAPEPDEADMLVDEEAISLPEVPQTDANVRKTYKELRARLALDKAEVDAVLGRGDLTRWYPETFSLVFDESLSKRSAKDGFVLLPLLPGDWIQGCKVAQGGLSALPANDRYIKVSRNECKRARAECKTTSLAAKSAPEHSRYQRGARAERKLIEDIATNIKGNKNDTFRGRISRCG